MADLLDKVIYNSEVMQHLRKDLGPFIDSATSILFWGETKSGMGFFARAIHEHSQRSGKFLVIPGFSLDEDTVKQLFLGIDERPGWLEEAHNGTIFLKRISEASPAVQKLLLQLIGTQSADGHIHFSRKGTTESLEVNVRFTYSMTHDFNMAVQDELLRRDFADEIKKRGRIVHLPPLRERKEDIISIAENFFEELNPKYNQHISFIDDKAQDILINYIWPGNIDELKRVIEGIFCQNFGITTITEEHIPEHIKNPEITGDQYSFKLKDDVKFVGKILLPPELRIQTGSKIVRLRPEDVVEIVRVEDTKFAPPKFRHFAFKLKDGSQITGKFLDPKMIVWTSFDSDYGIITQDIYSIFLSHK
jgi:DNA-binding NtrC family response regulator